MTEAIQERESDREKKRKQINIRQRVRERERERERDTQRGREGFRRVQFFCLESKLVCGVSSTVFILRATMPLVAHRFCYDAGRLLYNVYIRPTHVARLRIFSLASHVP